MQKTYTYSDILKQLKPKTKYKKISPIINDKVQQKPNIYTVNKSLDSKYKEKFDLVNQPKFILTDNNNTLSTAYYHTLTNKLQKKDNYLSDVSTCTDYSIQLFTNRKTQIHERHFPLQLYQY